MNAQLWIDHFQRNRSNRPEPDWSAPLTVPKPVLPLLTRSLEQFQLGDGGGPASLQFWILGRAAATVLWTSHGSCLNGIGASRTEYDCEVRLELRRFIRQLCRAVEPYLRSPDCREPSRTLGSSPVRPASPI